MPVCAVLGCSNRTGRKSVVQKALERKRKITFHAFPKNLEKRNAWLKAIRRIGWNPSKGSALCSEHFPADSFDRTSLVCVRLRESAIPTILRPAHTLEEETNTKMSPLICIIQPVPSLDNTQPLTSPAKKKLRLILPKSNTGNTSSDADIETTLLPASSTDSTTEAQCSQDSIDSSPNTQMNTISTNTKEEDVNLETDVHHFEEIYIKEEPLEENTSDYEYDNFLQDIKEESDNVNEIDIKEENEIM